MASFLKTLHNISFACIGTSVHLKTISPHIDFDDGAVIINSESVASRGRSLFHGFSSRGLGGTMVHGIVWFNADSRKVRTEKLNLERQVFNYWPGGGGMLEAGARPSQGYHIVGSWGQWEQVDEMVRTKDGSYTFVVTLGIDRVESFQIWLDGEGDRVLHPNVPRAGAGSVVYGPSDPMIAEGLRWTIDGRTMLWDNATGRSTLGQLSDGPSTGKPQDALQVANVEEYPLASARDVGRPGDQYEVKLLVAGKYRAVSWSKIRSVEGVPDSLRPMVDGRYYVAGAWNNWDFQEMTLSSTGSGLYTAVVSQGFRSGEFMIVRNKDWEQAFYPAAGMRMSSTQLDADDILGPQSASGELVWRLGGRSTDEFEIQFQRTFEQGKDLKRISWRPRPAM